MTTDHKELIAELRKRSIHLMDSGGFGNAWFDTMKLIDKAADALEEAGRANPPADKGVDLEAIAEEFELGEPWISSTAASAIVRKHINSQKDR